MKKLIPMLLSISALIISVSVAYYFLIYIPKRDESLILFEREKFREAEEAEARENALRYIKQGQLDACLNEVSERFKNALKDNNTATLEESKWVMGLLQQQRDECFRKFPLD